jgi:hypothetical protein
MIRKVSATGRSGWADSVQVIHTQGTVPTRLQNMIWFAANITRQIVLDEFCKLLGEGAVNEDDVNYVLRNAKV